MPLNEFVIHKSSPRRRNRGVSSYLRGGKLRGLFAQKVGDNNVFALYKTRARIYEDVALLRKIVL